MSTGLRLGEFATTPLYNIKAVVQATNISPSTLRAWERRYKVTRPQRSESGYRLYSERDIAVIRWLKAQIDAGMSISQAVTWLGKLTDNADEIDQAILPTAGKSTSFHSSLSKRPTPRRDRHRERARTFDILQDELLNALMEYDEVRSEAIISEAFTLYTIEQVGERLLFSTLLAIHEGRQRGDLGITSEQFSSNFLIQRLSVLLRSTPNSANGPMIWVGSSHNNLHEASALLLTLHLRRVGYHVHYLGRSLPIDEASLKDLVNEARIHQPALMIFSASTVKAIEKQAQRSIPNGQSTNLSDFISYSCPIHNLDSQAQSSSAGVYIGSYIKEVVENVGVLLDDSHLPDSQRRLTKSW